jgi:hypothetical protein
MATTAFPVNPALTAIAIGYRNRDIDLIADRILPRIGKTGKKFKYTVYPVGDAYTVPNTRVARRAAPTQVDFGGTEVNDECVDYGLDDVLPNDEVLAWEQMPKPASGGPVSPMAKATSLLTGLILLDREIRVANLVFAQATYPAANRVLLSGTSQWSDFTNSNPVDAILAALDVPIFQVNAGAVTREQVAAFFEVREVVVGAGFVNTARKGQAPVMSRVWGKHAAALFISQDAADADQPTFGFTAEFGDRIAGDMNEPKLGLRGSTIIRVGESVKEVISAAASGYYFENAVA